MNELIFPELTFEEARHQYKLNGIIIPSVTTIMKPLSNALYRDIDETILNRAANRGTAVHNAIENYLDFGIMDVDPLYLGYVEAFQAWEDAFQPIVHATENRTYHKVLRYAGTADLVATINDELTLVDYKTSATVNEMLTGVQLAAYMNAYGSHDIKFENAAILHLRPDGKYEWVEYGPNDLESWETFCACLTVHRHVEKYKWRNVS